MLNRIASILEEDMEQSNLLEEIIEEPGENVIIDLIEQTEEERPKKVHLFEED